MHKKNNYAMVGSWIIFFVLLRPYVYSFKQILTPDNMSLKTEI